MERFAFHIPNHFIREGEVWACANYNFKRELMKAFAESGEGYFFTVTAKRFLMGSEFPFAVIVVYETNDSGCLYSDIFMELVRKYHSALKQEQYYYERGDMLVHFEIGGQDDENG